MASSTQLQEIEAGFKAAGFSSSLVAELMTAYLDAKERFCLGDHRPLAIEGGRFSEAVFRVLQQQTAGSHTPLGVTLPSVDRLIETLANIPTQGAPQSVRIHIPRTLRLIYDVRNQRDVAHLGDGIDPNIQDASLVLACMDWVLAELVRLYHSVPPDEAHELIERLVTKAVPAIEEIDGQIVVLKDLQPRDQALLVLYRAGREKGLPIEGLVGSLRVVRRSDLVKRLRRLDEQRLVLEHPQSGRFHITARGIREVEERNLASGLG